MVTIGSQLTAPESGWKRYDDAEPFISYTGFTQRNHAVTGAYEGKSSYNANGSAVGEVVFSFVGTKVRIISSTTNTSRAESVSVSINGNAETFTARTNANQAQTLVYEKKNLPYGTHTVKIFDFKGVLIGSSAAAFGLDAIDIDSDGRLVRSIGSEILTPDGGWKRYDDRDVYFVRDNISDWTLYSHSSAHKGSYLYATKPSGETKISFDFIGTKIRVIDVMHQNRGISKIVVDGVEYTYSSTDSSSGNFQRLAFELLDLHLEKHSVILSYVSGTYISFDAIDIDSDGRLFHPEEVEDVSKLTIGKRIRCNYAVTSNGGEGVFSGLGKETDDFIRTSPTVPAINKGDFYFIMADEFNNKNILIADRNIQSFVSWDQLNSYGRIFGIPVDMGMVGFNFVARLLTGGITSNDDYSEWYKYIVTSTLNNTISSGDNNVWNWNSSSAYSWTTTTVTASSSSRARKGLSAVNAFNAAASSSVTSNTGYRPLFEVETLPMNRSFINHKGAYKRFYAGTPEIPETHATTDSIPPMISKSSPSGFASASAYFSSYDAWQAFSDTPSGNMAWICTARTGWICYRFDIPKVITKYTILPPSDNTSVLTRSPKDWIIEGSNDSTNGSDGTWVTIDTVTGVTGWEMNKKKEFTCSNINSYLSYRIRITLNSGDTSYVSIWQIELMERITAVPAIPSMWNTISETLPSVDTFINDGMDDLSVVDRKNENFVQIMTVKGSLGSGKFFKGSVELKKNFEITSVSVK